jgi:CRP-like cAMP-binding protein
LAGAVALADLELLADVPPDALASIEARLTPVRADAGAVVLRQGDPGDCFLLIVTGEAAVVRDEREVDVVGPGSIVGELALLHRGPRTATITATTPLVGLTGDAGAFAALAEAPGVQARFGRTAAQRLVANARPVPAALPDGTTVTLRPVVPADRARLDEAFDGAFSAESIRKRFFSPGRPSQAMITYLVDVDYVNHFAWIIFLDEGDGPHGVASTRYVRLRDAPDTAEISLAALDAYQGRGLGRLMLGALAASAPVGDVRRFRASVLSDNTPMRSLLDKVGAHWEFEEPGVVATTIDVGRFEGLVDASTTAALHDAAHDIVAAAHLALA